MARLAVVLMNLGGPACLAAVEPFLYSLFSDPAIIPLPAVLRLPLARLAARRRAPAARAIYSRLGGASPLTANTLAQARALEEELGEDARVFVAMRYAPPMTRKAVREVLLFAPEEVVCLPLYPQFSNTTTASSLAVWRSEARRQGLLAPTRSVSSYPAAQGFIDAEVLMIAAALDAAADACPRLRLLLTAHGLPERIVRRGDPYPNEVAATAAAIAAALARPQLDWRVCYQSRVGPLAWIGPSTEEEIRRAGRDRAGLVVAPISFVSEHSETLVELDLDYRRLAEECGVPLYCRVRTVGTHPLFIRALAALVAAAPADTGGDPCGAGA
jgi:protoporphyrin/coproporphyrin ferrochelatase